MIKTLIVRIAKDSKFWLAQTAIDAFFAKHPEYANAIEFNDIANNTNGLPFVYNNILEKIRLEKTYDRVIFMHADVDVNLETLIPSLDAVAETYDVIGLCGCSKISVSESPLNWYTGSKQFPFDRWGCVTHGELHNQTTFFNEHSSSITHHAVSCIDGLCIVLNKTALYSDIKFDETFMFDQYDTDFSFQCLMKYKFNLGVVINKSLCHYSVGKSITTKDFLLHEYDLRKKWNFVIPPQVLKLKSTDLQLST